VDKLDPDIFDKWVGIVANRGVTIVISTVVVLLVSGFAYLFWKYVKDLLPEIKDFFVEAKLATVENKQTNKQLADTLSAIADDRRQCHVNTQIALMNTDVHTLMARGTPHEKEIEALNQAIKVKAMDALYAPHPHHRSDRNDNRS
jgi:hypothetical protein